MSGYLRALPILLGIEGGRNDDPDDLGGRTNFGVTQDVYDEYRDHRRLPRQDVYLITTDEVRDLYHVLYWLRAKCDSLPWPMSHVHFDTSVHHGVDMAARSLQRTVGVKDDAIVGPITRAAVDAAIASDMADGEADFMSRYLWHRFDLFVELAQRKASQRKWFRGWCNRLYEIRHRYARAA